jgi:hypothetical protein
MGESGNKIVQISGAYLGKDLERVSSERFGMELPELDLRAYRTMIVAPELDDSAECIVNCLA